MFLTLGYIIQKAMLQQEKDLMRGEGGGMKILKEGKYQARKLGEVRSWRAVLSN